MKRSPKSASIKREKECEILLRENVDLVPGARVKYFLLDRLTEAWRHIRANHNNKEILMPIA